MKDLIIIGAGGHGRVVETIASFYYKSIFFLDDKESDNKVIGLINEFSKYIEKYDLFVAIGDGEVRKEITEKIDVLNGNLISLIHPSAIISKDVEIGKGTVIMPGAVINCGSKIKNGVIVNTLASIDHDCIIENFVHISPGVHLAGAVHINNNTWIGIGTNVCNNLNICENCIIGAGSVVIDDVKKPGVYVGNPAKKIK